MKLAALSADIARTNRNRRETDKWGRRRTHRDERARRARMWALQNSANLLNHLWNYQGNNAWNVAAWKSTHLYQRSTLALLKEFVIQGLMRLQPIWTTLLTQL